ncbi:hypothetical protein Btru_047077 [Bulinus truncatus]|nr:hypothetical protein Btru_047077 [Bulinus truncatus]
MEIVCRCPLNVEEPGHFHITSQLSKHQWTNSICTALEQSYWLQSAQALSIVGVILSGAGVVAAVAWLFTDLYRCVNLFLVASVTSAVIGGVLILSSDITFAAKYSIEFYHNRWSNDIYFTLPQTSTALPTPTPERMAYEIAAFDRVMGVAWSFALDIAAGSLCIVSALPLLLVSMAVIDRPDTNKTSSASDTRRLSVPENMEFVKVIEGEVKL